MDSRYSSISPGGIGKTAAEMRMLSTYTAIGWDFVGEAVNGTADIWRLCEDGADYPRLAREYSRAGDFACPEGVALEDLLELAGRWMKAIPDEAGAADGTSDGVVNYDDFALLGEHWLFRQTAKPVGHWPLDGDFLSSVGGYSGTPVGDPEFVGQTEARIGSGALALDGDDSVVVEGFKGIAGSRARTCMAWIKTQQNISSLFWWGDPSKSGGLWQVGVNEGGLVLNINYGGLIWTTTPVNTGQWVHVAVVLPDRTNRLEDVRLFVNGIPEPKPIIPTWAPSFPINTLPTADFRIGSWPEGFGYDGLIDDIRIYDWALTAAEIQTIAGQ
jgi:hypothetical protein